MDFPKVNRFLLNVTVLISISHVYYKCAEVFFSNLIYKLFLLLSDVEQKILGGSQCPLFLHLYLLHLGEAYMTFLHGPFPYVPSL